jgi:hypothetical protein
MYRSGQTATITRQNFMTNELTIDYQEAVAVLHRNLRHPGSGATWFHLFTGISSF